MTRRAFVLAAAFLPMAVLPVIAQERPVVADQPAASRTINGKSQTWEGYTFDTAPPLISYVVARRDTLTGSTVEVMTFFPTGDPVGPIEVPATGPFAKAVVGDALMLGVEGIVNNGN